MFGLDVIVALVSTVILGTVLGRRYRVGPPVLLILLGSLLGLIPVFGDVRINGEIVLLLFLPAILYWESLNTSFREIRKNLRVIFMSAIALVIVTAVAISWTARAHGDGIARGRGPRRRALPHRRGRCGRSGEKAATPGPDRAARREHHQRRDRAGPVRRDRPRRGRRGRGRPARLDRPVYRLLPRRYRRGPAGRRSGDVVAQGNRRAAGGRRAEPAHAVRGVLAGPSSGLQRRGRGHGVRADARLLRAGGDPGSVPAARLRILGYRDIHDQRLAVGVCRNPDPRRAARD